MGIAMIQRTKNDMNTIDSILQFNRQFVVSKGYEPYVTDKFPAKKLAVLSCMDTRLTVLLQEALGLTVEAIVQHPLMPADITVRGFIMETLTGELTEVK